MLVLSRKQDEEILISGGIRIRVIRVSGNRVQLGIEAADDVRIQRSELINQALAPIAETPVVLSKAG